MARRSRKTLLSGVVQSIGLVSTASLAMGYAAHNRDHWTQLNTPFATQLRPLTNPALRQSSKPAHHPSRPAQMMADGNWLNLRDTT
jgi:hypothetical protein